MEFSQVLDAAITAALDDSKNGRFEFLSEKDIQALVFHHAATFAEQEGLPLKLHAEPSRAELRPDLVLGDNEVFVEIKLSKAKTGGYTESLTKWHEDIFKLRTYRKIFPAARCVFLAIDEAFYHSNPSSLNFFDPSKENLNGEWRQLPASSHFLIAEL